jgi:hypothetical protein
MPIVGVRLVSAFALVTLFPTCLFISSSTTAPQSQANPKLTLWFAKTLADFEINDIAVLPSLLWYNS